jgi:hypothetical protein
MTANEFARKTIESMQLQGRKCVVVVKKGETYSGRPIVFYEGTTRYAKLVATKRMVIVGYYDPECLVRHLAGDVAEFF